LLADIALVTVKVLGRFMHFNVPEADICQGLNERVLILNLRLDTGEV